MGKLLGQSADLYTFHMEDDEQRMCSSPGHPLLLCYCDEAPRKTTGKEKEPILIPVPEGFVCHSVESMLEQNREVHMKQGEQEEVARDQTC